MPRLEISLHGHLLVAGSQASALGVDLATARRFHDGHEVPYIPATALRGAVRTQLEALLAGIGQADVGPYPLDAAPGAKADDFQGPVARLFGFSGRRGERGGAREGCLRFSDAMPEDPVRAKRALGVRPGLELNDFTGTAEEQKLFFREVAEVDAEPLVFHAWLDIQPTGDPATFDKDKQCLQAAVESTDAIGAGKSKGGGFVSIRWIDEDRPLQPRIAGEPSQAARARLLLTLKEPAHFGDGGPQGNHHGTRTWIPGATVRGSVAWALLRDGVSAESPEFRNLFLREESPASFGDALLVHDPDEEPMVVPATARERRGAKGEVKDILVTELAREQVNERLGDGLHLRADDGDDRYDPLPARPAPELVRRTRTRVSIDRHQGIAADGRLFSIEQVEPWLVEKDDEKQEQEQQEKEKKPPRPAVFSSRVEGLDEAGANLLARAAGLPILIGAGRNHGMGCAELEVRFEGPSPLAGEERALELSRRIDEEAARLAARAGLSGPVEDGGDAWLALTAVSDFAPTDRDAAHPLAEPVLADVASGLQPVRRFLHPGSLGGYDQTSRDGALKELVPTVGAGSVFVYRIPRNGLTAFLDRILPALRRGVGSRVESGCGRFALFEPMEKGEKR